MLRFDRSHATTFARFLWRRFRDDNCFETAGALAYTTLFALVPLTTAVLGILSAFPVFQDWRIAVTDFIFDNFVPTAGRAVQSYLTQFADNASRATAFGIIILFASALMMLASIEDAFNRIWRVPRARRTHTRVLTYWMLLTLGPLLLVAVLALSSYLFALPLLVSADATYGLKLRLLGLLPFALTWFALTAGYVLVPNRSVAWRNALIGGLLATLLFEVAKRGFALYLLSVPSYEQVYGTLAVVPIFLIWIYLSWIVVLLGASFAAALGDRPRMTGLPAGQEFIGLLRVLTLFADAQREGRGLHRATLLQRLPFLSNDLLERYLADLARAGLIERSESGDWLLGCDLRTVSLLALYAGSGYRPPGPGVAAASDLDALPAALQLRLDALARALRVALDVPLAEIFPATLRSDLQVSDSIDPKEKS